jgi:hypothetical protein
VGVTVVKISYLCRKEGAMYEDPKPPDPEPDPQPDPQPEPPQPAPAPN